MSEQLLLVISRADRAFLPQVKSLFAGLSVYVRTDSEEFAGSFLQLKNFIKQHGITKVISSSPWLLTKLRPERTHLTLDAFAGSLISHEGVSYLFIDPLEHILTVKHGRFMAARYLSKFLKPEVWLEPSRFNWTKLDASNFQAALDKLSTCKQLAVDIETKREPLSITHISYTGVFWTSNSTWETYTYTQKIREHQDLTIARLFLNLPAEKIFQNGKYDNAYLSRFNSPVHGYLWDTANLFHCWLAELPKDLGFLTTFALRTVEYWKDLADTQDPEQYEYYAARDSWATANVCISLIREMPQWALHNYRLEFPLVFPCHMAEMTGIEQDQERKQTAKVQLQEQLDSLQLTFDKVFSPGFNPSSHVQVKRLMGILGEQDPDSSDEKALSKLANKHPINAWAVSKLLEYRGVKKLVTTYLKDCDFNGLILYSINPHGTDTGRNASKEHHFWCGLQIQNIPGGKAVKQTLKSFEGFTLAECDLEQAESRDTANISGSEPLIAAVSGDRDFHSVNCSAFFGIPYASIYDQAKGKTINKPLRDLAKRVNHGANYNMGPGVLVDTMGEMNVLQAARLLGLPKYLKLKQIAEYLLERFHLTYPEIKGSYYPWVVNQVRLHSRLTSQAIHATRKAKGETKYADWTRFTFGRPWSSKPDLNSLVAHCPQSLNARTLNEAFMEVFYQLALPHSQDFKLCAQIHDSILFQYRDGMSWMAEKVKELMEIEVDLIDVSGTRRIFTVPAAIKDGRKLGKPAKYWSETE